MPIPVEHPNLQINRHPPTQGQHSPIGRVLSHRDLGGNVIIYLSLVELTPLLAVSTRVSDVCKRALRLLTHVTLHPTSEEISAAELRLLALYGRSLVCLNLNSCELAPQVHFERSHGSI